MTSRCILLFLTLGLGCTSGPATSGPAGARMDQDWKGDWTPPPLPCQSGPPITQIDEVRGVTQMCTNGEVAHGAFLLWHPSGQKATEGRFDEGERHGQWVWWHDNGRIATRGSYRQGRQIGEWTWWHDNGQTEQRGTFLGGLKAGEWSTWHDNGQLHTSGLYDNGRRTQRWGTWRADGSPAHQARWVNGKIIEEEDFEPPDDDGQGQGEAPK